MLRRRFFLAIIFFGMQATIFANDTVIQKNKSAEKKERSDITTIASNPAAVNVTAGTGDLQAWIQKKLHIKNNHGVQFTGAWIGDTNAILAGGVSGAQQWANNSLLLFDMTINTEKWTHGKAVYLAYNYYNLMANLRMQMQASSKVITAYPALLRSIDLNCIKCGFDK